MLKGLRYSVPRSHQCRTQLELCKKVRLEQTFVLIRKFQHSARHNQKSKTRSINLEEFTCDDIRYVYVSVTNVSFDLFCLLSGCLPSSKQLLHHRTYRYEFTFNE